MHFDANPTRKQEGFDINLQDDSILDIKSLFLEKEQS
jgi:hypothetical protein